MKPILRTLSLILLLSGSLSLHATEINFLYDWEEALEAAKEADKPIFLDAYTTWCGPCKWMAATVMTQDEVADFYNENFINVKLDMERGDGLEIAKEYKVAAYPSLLYFSNEGRAVHRVVGAYPADKFLAVGKEVLEMDDSLQDMYDQYATGEYDQAFLAKYLKHAAESAMRFEDAKKAFEEMSAPEVILEPVNFEVFTSVYRNPDNKFFPYFRDNLDIFAQKYDQEKVMDTYYMAYLTGAMRAIYSNKPETAREYLAQVEGQGNEVVQGRFYEVNFELLKRHESEEEAYNQLHKWVREGKIQNSNMLNAVAWGVYEKEDADADLIDMAITWAAKSVELNPGFANMDTYAMLMYKGGNLQRAAELAKEAIEMAKANGEDYASTEAALKKMQEEM